MEPADSHLNAEHWTIPGTGPASRSAACATFNEVLAETAAIYRQRIHSATTYYRMPSALCCASFKLLDERLVTVIAREHGDHIDVLRFTEQPEAGAEQKQSTIN